MVPGLVLAAIVGAALGVVIAVARQRRLSSASVDEARATAKAAVARARREAQAIKAKLEAEARAEALGERTAAEAKLASRAAELERRSRALAGERDRLQAEIDAVQARDRELDDRHRSIQSRRDRCAGLIADAEDRRRQARAVLEERVGRTSRELAQALGRQWVEQAQADAAHRLRSIEQSAGDALWNREAERMLDIASSRYQNHFLTERLISNIKVEPSVAEVLTRDDGRVLQALQEAANVTLHVSDTGEAVRLEGLDGIGREIARRALAKLGKKSKAVDEANREPAEWAGKIREQLEREIIGLGRKAFQVLEIPRAHPEIVDLVGRLNWRTSYTQNQWLHAVEASFLAGMMASELGLDVKVARRATLMHDIGKALTHVIDGSHAVIGADIARRLGEDEVVANAIGAHHLDEPMNSAYAHLVAAADAMSGARPGARREHEGGYNTKLADLERIGRSYREVNAAYAVHGGRELRVYVDDARVSDLRAVELSSEIAEQISEEMVFPGQIKVTVIRETEAVSVAS